MGLFSRSAPASHFPQSVGRRLGSGDEVRLPDDLPADATLLVVLFRDDLDPLADQWARLGDRLADVHGDRVGVWELPIVSKKLKMFGKLATMGIRGQVDGESERERTVPLYVDPKGFRKELQLKTQSDVYAFLVARDGRIAWRGEGDIDMEEVEALEQAVEDVLAAPVPAPTDHPDAEGAEPPSPDADAAPPPEDDEAGNAEEPSRPASEEEAGDGAPAGAEGQERPSITEPPRPEAVEPEEEDAPAEARWNGDPPPIRTRG
ncbi:hypothetical protein [Rubrivirga litoralis]|uniref:AhpC/TSA family protein n=1 Tax=Rubrivirga litoralis TaxID=3075598 RepID=A0ABU3BV90_9BACT|nr:hypothetical protein [Rubrivirga sp. F394]MDT0633210.1 hypothetical protein [Rubrivirga sp. F394]